MHECMLTLECFAYVCWVGQLNDQTQRGIVLLCACSCSVSLGSARTDVLLCACPLAIR